MIHSQGWQHTCYDCSMMIENIPGNIQWFALPATVVWEDLFIYNFGAFELSAGYVWDRLVVS